MVRVGQTSTTIRANHQQENRVVTSRLKVARIDQVKHIRKAMEACMRSSVGRQLATLHNDKAEIGNVYQVLICWDVATVCRVLVSRQELKCLLWGPQRQSCVTVPSQRQIGPVIEWHRVRSPAGFLGTAADRAIGSDVFFFLLAHSRSGALDRQVRSAKLTVEKRWNCSFIDWIPRSL